MHVGMPLFSDSDQLPLAYECRLAHADHPSVTTVRRWFPKPEASQITSEWRTAT